MRELKKRSVTHALLGTVAVTLIACGGGTDPKDKHIEARVVCEDFVKDRLKSPGSADFTEQTEVGKYPTWIARGSVDSQNTFGALMRNQYWCTVTYHPSTDKWTLEEMTGLDN